MRSKPLILAISLACIVQMLAMHPPAIAQLAYPDSVFTQYFRQDSGWQAGDATISVPLPDGRVLWLFGDSYVDMAFNPADTSLPCLFNRRNAVVVQHPESPSTLSYLTSFQSSDEGHYYWPGDGFYRDGKVYLFLFEHNDTGFVGPRYAELSYPELSLLGIRAVPSPEDIQYGKSFLLDESGGWLYVFGNRKFPFGTQRYFAARCPLDSLMKAWAYWDGSDWAAEPAPDAHLLRPAVGSASFSIFPRNGKYYLLSQDNGHLSCGLGRDINLYVADSLQGPYEPFGLVYTIQDKYEGRYLATYNARAHPELEGGLLISYNVNDINRQGSGCPRQCKEDTRFNADTYRPKFVRIPWAVF